MISIRNVKTIAHYERKILSRSWFFRIFSILLLFVVGVFTAAGMLSSGGDFPASLQSLPTGMLYSALSLFNICQAVIALFLASDFMKRDKKLDTAEVLFIRPMTNAEYVIGKTVGILTLFVMLNLLVLVIVAIFQMASDTVPLRILPMLYYVLLLCLPSLIFILGLAFAAMSILKNQALTFLVLLGYISMVIFYLGEKQNYILDYMADQMPMVYSDLIGFGQFDNILIHRLAYTFAGMGFISLSVLLLKRLPQIRHSSVYVGIITALFFLASGSLFYKYHERFQQRLDNRKDWISQASDNFNYPIATMTHANLYMELGVPAKASAMLTLQNNTDQELDTLLFSLNPGLKVEKATQEGQSLTVQQDGILLWISGIKPLQPGDVANVSLEYQGTFDFDVSYLDALDENFFAQHGTGDMKIASEYGFYTDEYVLLTKENLWYPVAGIAYDPSRPAVFRQQFTRFDLTVKSENGLYPVSQGECTTTDSVTYHFSVRDPLPQLSLIASNYVAHEKELAGLKMKIACNEGHDYYSKYLSEIGDTLDAVVSEFLDSYERSLNLYYPYTNFSLVEVPVQYTSLPHSWTSAMAQCQPQMILFPERGFNIRQAYFKGEIANTKRRQRWTNEDLTDKEIQASVLYSFLSRTFSEESAQMSFQQMVINETAQSNPYNIFPNYYYFVNYITSEECPVLNYAFESYLKTATASDMGSFFRRMGGGGGLSDTDKANLILNGKSLEQVISTETDKVVVNNVLKAKGSYLLTWMEKQIGDTDFDTFLRDYLYKNSYREITYNEISEQISQRFNTSIGGFIGEWYKDQQIPAFAWTTLKMYETIEGDHTAYLMQTKVTNWGEAPGLIKFTFQTGGGGFGGPPGMRGGNQSSEPIEISYLIGVGETRDIQMSLDEQPRMVGIDTHVSKNIPASSIQFGLNPQRTKPSSLRAYNIESNTPVTFDTPGEILVDNDDEGFTSFDPALNNPIRKMFEKEKSGNREFVSENMFGGQSPATWGLAASNDYYGKFEHTAMIVQSGDGNKTATWTHPLTDEGYYDIYVYLNRQRRRGGGPGGPGGPGGRGGGSDPVGSYFYTVYHADGIDEVELKTSDFDTGWNLLGSFYISSGEGKIVLSDKGGAQIVVADAVKWIRQK